MGPSGVVREGRHIAMTKATYKELFATPPSTSHRRWAMILSQSSAVRRVWFGLTRRRELNRGIFEVVHYR